MLMITLSAAHQQFIGHLQGKSRASATILAYGKDIAQLVDFLKKLEKVEPIQVTTEDLQSFMDGLAKQAYTPKSISRKTNSTKTFFKFLKIASLITEDPANGLEHPKFENKPPRILTKLEYRALRDAARADIRIIAVIELLLQTIFKTVWQAYKPTHHTLLFKPVHEFQKRRLVVFGYKKFKNTFLGIKSSIKTKMLE